MTLLDEWMPAFDVSARHSIEVAARPERTYEVARNASLSGPLLVRVLMGLRVLPALVGAMFGRRQPRAKARDGVMLRAGLPFTLLAEAPGSEFVLGLAGQFWRPSGGLVATDAATFKANPLPGLAHATWNFRVEARLHGCVVTTETRVLCSDAATRRSFLRYWRVVRFGSGLIRRSMLREIRRRAEH